MVEPPCGITRRPARRLAAATLSATRGSARGRRPVLEERAVLGRQQRLDQHRRQLVGLEGLAMLARELDERHAAAVLDPPDRRRRLLEKARERRVIAPQQQLRAERQHQLALRVGDRGQQRQDQQPGRAPALATDAAQGPHALALMAGHGDHPSVRHRPFL
jgi:hypothetical protein